MTHRFRVRAFGVLATAAAVLSTTAAPAAAVTGGADADHPFVAHLAIGDTERACSGALVHPQLVLTAAACFAGPDGAVPAGEPASRTTVTVGRPVLSGTGGTVTTVTGLIPHPDRALVLARLETPATAAPVALATAAPEAGETLTVAGFGRTASDWVPGRLKAGRATVASVAGGTADVVPGEGGAGICRGDAGGPAFRVTGGTAELVAVHHSANQAGCLGEAAGDPRATETRVDDVRSWIIGNFPRFATGFEAGQPAPHLVNTVDDAGAGHGGLKNVVGICCSLTGPETDLRAEANVHGGSATALMYSGKDNNATSSYAYLKVFKPGNLRVRASTVLSYSIFPQSTTSNRGVTGTNSTCVAVDLIYSDGTTLRDSGVTDQRGNRVHPAHQCTKLPLDTWTEIVVPIGRVAEGKQISTVSIGYDQPANTGGYRGYVDDIAITDVVVPAVFATGLETGQTAPTWSDTVSTGAPAGASKNVSGICCSLTGPEAGVRPENPHSGEKVLMYSGKDDNATSSYAYLKAFQLSNTFVTPTTRLSYWIFPQSTTSNRHVTGTNSTCVSIDLILRSHADGTSRSLRDSGVVDSRGNSVHPKAQCTKLPLDRWTQVSVPLGAFANGREITQIDIGYDQPGATGGYRGYVDDIRIQS